MGKNILLVQNDLEETSLLCGKLESFGFQVRVANSGFEALTSLKRGFPDLIVSEAGMTDYSGSCLVKSLGELSLLRHIPVLVTGFPGDSLLKCAEEGVFIRSRPYGAEELALFIHQLT